MEKKEKKEKERHHANLDLQHDQLKKIFKNFLCHGSNDIGVLTSSIEILSSHPLLKVAGYS